MKMRFAFALAATFSVVGPMGTALASPAYDARTLGMGNSTVGYSGNASLAFWNPASVAMGTRFGMFLPSFSTSFSNNLLSPADAMSLAGSLQGSGQGASSSMDFSKLFTNMGSSTGLNLQADVFIEPLGMSLGKVGPGNMALRVYGHGLGFAQATVTKDLAQNMDGLFVKGGFTQITETLGAISSAAGNTGADSQSELKANIHKLGEQLKTQMSGFVLTSGEVASPKSLSLTAVTSANAAVAATYAQPIPVKFAPFPEGELTVGATAKVFVAPFGALGQPIAVPGSNGSLSPLGGGMGANIKLNIDKEVTDLVTAIDRFEAQQNLATTAEVMSKAGAFFNNGLSKSTIEFSSLTPDNVGMGMDLGAAYRFNKQFSVGLALTNPIMLWGAKKTTYAYDFSGDSIKVNNIVSRASFSQAEPFVVRVGGAYTPEAVKDFMVTAGMDAPINIGIPASVSLGAEKLFGPLALRVGTQQGGLSPLYTAGLGLQTSAFQINLGAGVDNPSPNAKAASVALSMGAGF